LHGFIVHGVAQFGTFGMIKNMKRPTIEYGLIAIGIVILVVNLVTAIPNPGPYAISAICSLLAFLPFCLPWHRKQHPFLFLPSLIIPILFCWIGIPLLISIYKSLENGTDVFAGLPASIFILFLTMHLQVLGTFIVTAYAAFQTIDYLKIRTSASSQ